MTLAMIIILVMLIFIIIMTVMMMIMIMTHAPFIVVVFFKVMRDLYPTMYLYFFVLASAQMFFFNDVLNTFFNHDRSTDVTMTILGR